jgi:uncharacterized protein
MVPEPPAPETRRKRWKQGLCFGAGVVLLAFVALNAMAYLHARAMTHFANGGERTLKPEALTVPQKLQVLLMGVTLPRPVNRQTPADFEMPFATVTLTNARGIRLEAWWIRQPAGKGTVLLFHGYGAGKDSLLPAAREFRRLGYETLLVDFYGSGGSQGRDTSIGFHEADDVLAAFQFARRQSPDQPLILYGVSMGAAAILTAAHVHRIDPDAVILECPFDRLLSTVQNRFRAMGLPAFPSAQLLVFWGGVQQGYNGFRFNPADYLRQVRCPALLLHGENDPRVTLSQMNRLAQNLNPSSSYKVFAGLEHQSYVSARPEEWRKDVAEFLANVRQPQAE